MGYSPWKPVAPPSNVPIWAPLPGQAPVQPQPVQRIGAAAGGRPQVRLSPDLQRKRRQLDSLRNPPKSNWAWDFAKTMAWDLPKQVWHMFMGVTSAGPMAFSRAAEESGVYKGLGQRGVAGALPLIPGVPEAIGGVGAVMRPNVRKAFIQGARDALVGEAVYGEGIDTHVESWKRAGAPDWYAYVRGFFDDAITDPLSYVGIGQATSFAQALKEVKAGTRAVTPELLAGIEKFAPDVVPQIADDLSSGLTRVAARAFEIRRAEHAVTPQAAIDRAVGELFSKSPPAVQQAFKTMVAEVGPDMVDKTIRTVAEPAVARAVTSQQRHWQAFGVKLAKTGTFRRAVTAPVGEPVIGPVQRMFSTGVRGSEMATEILRRGVTGPTMQAEDLAAQLTKAGYGDISQAQARAVTTAAVFRRVTPADFASELGNALQKQPQAFPGVYLGLSPEAVRATMQQADGLGKIVWQQAQNAGDMEALLGQITRTGRPEQNKLLGRLMPHIVQAGQAQNAEQAVGIMRAAALGDLRNVVSDNYLRLGTLAGTSPRLLSRIGKAAKAVRGVSDSATQLIRQHADNMPELQRRLLAGEDFGLAGTDDYEFLLRKLTDSTKTLHFGPSGLPLGRVPTFSHLKVLMNDGIDLMESLAKTEIADDVLRVAREDYIAGQVQRRPEGKQLFDWLHERLREGFGVVSPVDVARVEEIIKKAPRMLASKAEKDLDRNIVSYLLELSADGDEGQRVANYLQHIATRGGLDALPGFRGPAERDISGLLFAFGGKTPPFARAKTFANPLRAVQAGIDMNLDWPSLVFQRGRQSFRARARKMVGDAATAWGLPEDAAGIPAHWLTLSDAAAEMKVPITSVRQLWPELTGAKTLKFEPDIAYGLIRAGRFGPVDEALSKFQKHFLDPFTRSWKAGATVANWPWAMVNVLGNTTHLFLAGVNDPRGALIAAAAVAPEGSMWERGFSQAAARVAGDLVSLEKGRLMLKLPGGKMSLEEFRRVATEGAWQSGWASTALARIPERPASQVTQLINRVANPLSPEFLAYLPTKATGRWTEDVAKLWLGADRLFKGDHPNEAGRLIRRALIDYADMTPTEKNVFRRVWPFWTWMRNNLTFQVSTLIEKPGRWRLPMHMVADLRAFVSEQDKVPQELWPPYFHQGFTQQMPNWKDADGNPVFATFRLPQEDMTTLLNLQELVGSIGPWKLPLELWLNKSFFFDGRPIDWRKAYAAEGTKQFFAQYDEVTGRHFWAPWLPSWVYSSGAVVPGKDKETGEDILYINRKFAYAVESLIPQLGRLARATTPPPGRAEAKVRLFGKDIPAGFISYMTGVRFTSLDLAKQKERYEREQAAEIRGAYQRAVDTGQIRQPRR